MAGDRALTALPLLLATALLAPNPAVSQPPLPPIDSLWDYSRPADSERRFREILPRARETGGPGYLAELLSQIARTHSLRGQFPQAETLLAEAEAALQGVPPDGEPRARVRILLERGRVLNSSGRPAEAAEPFRRAYELARASGEEFLEVDAAHMLGIVLPGDEGIGWNLRGIERARASAELRVRGWLGPLHNNLGWTLADRGDYREALAHFRESREAYEARGAAGPVRVARWSAAKMQRLLGEVEIALAEQEALAREWEEAGAPDGYVCEELGECLLLLGRGEEARPHFARAYRLLAGDAHLTRNEPDRLQRLRDLGGG